MDKTFFALGCALAGLGVIAGAFGAHALRDHLSPERLVTYETAVRYQMYHAFALIATAWAVNRWPASAAVTAGWFFVAGIVIFSGTVYALAFGSPRWLGAVTPIGGLSLIIGWVVLAWTVYNQKS